MSSGNNIKECCLSGSGIITSVVSKERKKSTTTGKKAKMIEFSPKDLYFIY